MEKVLWIGLACWFCVLLGCGESSMSKEEEVFIVQVIQDKLGIEEGQPWGYAIAQGLFNDDDIKDYVINYDVMGHHSLAVFDGETLVEIEIDSNTPIISRVGVPINVQLMNILPDASQEIIVHYGGGGSRSNNYYMSIYDVEQGRLKRLLVETVSAINGEKAMINHIEIVDNNKDGLCEVLVYAGQIKDKSAQKTYNKGTKAVDDTPKKIYCYDEERKLYLENVYGEECY